MRLLVFWQSAPSCLPKFECPENKTLCRRLRGWHTISLALSACFARGRSAEAEVWRRKEMLSISILPGWCMDQKSRLVSPELPKDWQPKIYWAVCSPIDFFFNFGREKSRVPMSLEQTALNDASPTDRSVQFIAEREMKQKGYLRR